MPDHGRINGRIITRTTHRNPARKAKKSYTLSPESVNFLETLRKKRRARSISFVLEEILQAARREAELARINQSVSDYYDSLTDEEAEELSEWGKFGLSQLVIKDDD